MCFRGCALCLILLSVSLRCRAEETVCLTSGFCLEAISHTGDEEHLVFRVGAGSIELQSREIARIEQITGSAPAKPEPSLFHDDPQTLVKNAAESQGIDTDFLRSVASIESGFRQASLSKRGAAGLMQIMPATAKELGINAADAQENALGGAKYLRWLLVRYHFNSALTLAAYNAGPGAVERFNGVPPFGETRAYILKVTREYDRRKCKSAANTHTRLSKAASKTTSTN